MAVISDFDGLLSNAAERFYDDAIEPNTGCLEDFLDCEDEDDVEEIFNDYRYSDNGEESLNAAVDDAMTYTDDMWAIIVNYATPSDILNGELEGLEICDSFANDIFDEAKSMAISDFEKIKQMAQENEEQVGIMADFYEVLKDAADRFYDSVVDDEIGCMNELLECEDEDDVEEVLENYRYEDDGMENLNDALDCAMTYNVDAWAVIMKYTSPSDIFNRKADGLEIYDAFSDDVFEKTKEMINDDLEELKQKAQENQE